nr:GNAT family protein [Natranaerovirga hydrolytica]
MLMEYTTKRLLLKVLDSSYHPLVVRYYLKNREFLEPWEPIKPAFFYDPIYQKNLLTWEYKDIVAKKLLRLWIFKKDKPNKIIGTLSFNNIVQGFLLSCELGYKLDCNELNNGYMTEAIQKGISIIFDEYKLHRIEANIMPNNIPSLNVIKKLGFEEEGISRKYIQINGKWEDHKRFSLINE